MTHARQTKTALLIDGPTRADWHLVDLGPDEDRQYDAIEQALRGGFEIVYVVRGLTVYVNDDGRATFPPYVRALQAEPNPLYPDGVMVLHGPVLVLGPIKGDEETSLTPDARTLAEAVFAPVAP